MTTKYFIPVFITAVWSFSLAMEGYSCTRISIEKEARLNRDPLRYALIAPKHHVEEKYDEAVRLTDDPKLVMSEGEMFVLTSKFDYDRASPEKIEKYYRKLKSLGMQDLPPLWDKRVQTTDLKERAHLSR